jgi:two-component system, NarL family, nitrate/nitrite response regulator NarL
MREEAPIRLLLVDDHPLVRDGLRARLAAVPGFAVVGEADQPDAAIRATQQLRPDLVLMDVGLKAGLSGIDTTRALRVLPQAPRVLRLTMHNNPRYVREALAAGASGYLLKDSPAEEVVQAIRTVAAGGQHLAVDLAEALDTSSGPRGREHLTPREREVLGLIAEGLTSKLIGERLGMGVRTVETHRLALRRKLGCNSPAALLRYAIEQAAPAAKVPGR